MMLPEGWAETTIGEVTSVRSDKANPTTLGATPFVGLEHIEPQTSRLITVGSAADVRSAVAQFRAGDVLYGRLRPYLNKVIEASFDGCASAEILPFAPYPGVLSSMLKRVMMSARFLEYTASLDKGDRPRVNAEEVGSFEFQLPPAAEQRRIVAKLDALTARLARARAELERVSVLAANLRLAALREAYDRAAAHRVLALGDLIETLDQGWSPKCENYPSSTGDEWAVLKTTAVQAIAYRSGENKVLPPGLAPRPSIEVKAGDVLVTRAGPRVRCGVTCLVETTRPRLMLADKMYRLRCKEHVNPAFLTFMLNSPQALERIEVMKTGISDSGLNLTQAKFLALELPAPSTEVQNGLVAVLRTAFARANRMKAEATRARALIDRLEASILGRAFRGELVPQDPNDEPASVLLDRIRAERAAAPRQKRGRRAKAG